jgi:ATP-dependent 26S proteasome regulatory subunit
MAAKTEGVEIKLNGEFEESISAFMRAMIPALFMQTVEEKRVLDRLVNVIHYLSVSRCGARDLFIWSDCSFKKWELFKRDGQSQTGENCTVTDLEYKELFQALKDFAKPESTDPIRHKASVLVLADPAHALESATNVRCLKETLQAIRGWRKTIILIGRNFQLPKELQTDVTVVPFDLPTAEELNDVASSLIKAYPSCKGYESVKIDQESIRPFARACSGITEEEMRALIGLSIAKHRAFDERAIPVALKEKERIVRRSNVLECHTSTGDLDQIGGLCHVKEYINEITPIFQNPEKAREYGVRIPPGVLLLGVPGCGKSLTAQMLGSHWKLPRLRFDVGRAFGSLVGESEGNIREMISVAEACAPVVLHIDEIEKGLGGDSLDGGTSSRVLATLLTWMEDKPQDVFIVATANDLRKLQKMPELISRFSDSFFVDLPDTVSRVDILGIHLNISKHKMSASDLQDVAVATNGYSGRELRNVVHKALAIAFKQGLPHPTVKELLLAAKLIVPTSQTMRESISDLRKWCKSGRSRPAGALLEADDVGGDDKVFGLPDLK